jgi:hypothetical protein
LINSVGSIAGFLAPYSIGWIKDAVPDNDTLPVVLVRVAGR